ncbi:MAG TPA: hypothetical protein V6D11_19990 [Waterburya sp.]
MDCLQPIGILWEQSKLERGHHAITKCHAHTTANPKFRDSSLEFIQNSTGGHFCPIHALRLTRQRREALSEHRSRESMISNHRANLHHLTDWGEAGDACWLPRSRDAPPI